MSNTGPTNPVWGTPVPMAGVYNNVTPTPATGQAVALQTDSNGNLLVSAVITAGGSSGTQYADGVAAPSHPTGTALIFWDHANTAMKAVYGRTLTNSQSVDVSIVDGNGNQITSFGGGSQFAMGSAQASNANGTIALGYDGTNVRGILVDSTGNQAMNLAKVGGTAFALGQQLAASSLPVVLTAAQLATLTPLSTVAVTFPGSPVVWIKGNAGATLDAAQNAAAATNTVGIGLVYNNSPITVTNTNQTAAQSDISGNLKIVPGLATLTLTAWTPSNWTGGFTANLATFAGNPDVIVQLDQNASITAGAVTWQGTYDNVNWVTIPAQQIVDPTSATFAQIANPYTFSVSSALNKAFLIQLNGFQSIRALESTPMTGAGASITPYVNQLAYQMLQASNIVNTVNTSFNGVAQPVTLTSTTITGTPTINLTQMNSVALGSPSAQGTLQTTGNIISTNSQMFAGTTALAVVNTNCLKTDQSSQAGTAITTVPVAFGSGTPSGNAPGTNSAMYVGTTAVRTNQATTAAGAVDVNNVGINATTIVTAAAGVQRVGIAGNANATIDATVAAGAAPTNALGQLVQSTNQANVPALTTGQTVQQQGDVTGAARVNIAGRMKTYSAMTPIASAGGVAGFIAVLPGNATTTVHVTSVEVTLSTSGTAAVEQVQLIKLSSAPTGGTTVNMVVVPHDASDAAANSVPLAYTAASSGGGAAVGPIRCSQFFDESGTVTGSNTWRWTFGDRGGSKPITLRTTAQCLAVNLGAVVATQTAIVSFEWEEDTF
jgi:hypothetical protein